MTPIKVPPATEVPVKASEKIILITFGTASKLAIKIKVAVKTYSPPIMGTSQDDALAILVSPPIITVPASTAIISPQIILKTN